MSEAADLVERLRAIAENDWRISFLAHTSDTANEAADLIVSQEAELAKLREALRPFCVLAPLIRDEVPNDTPVVNILGENPLTAGHFRRARLALSENTDA